MPIYGHGLKGREAMVIGMGLYNLIVNFFYAGTKNHVHIPKAQLINAEEVLKLFPDVESRRLNGAAVWYEGFCQNTERLVLLFIKSAFEKGAVISNYTKATKYTEYSDGTVVVSARDILSCQKMDIKAERVINCTGPWYDDTLRRIEGLSQFSGQEFAAGLNLVTKPIFNSQSALGLINPYSKKSRLFFIVPWRNRSIIGTEWLYINSQPGEFPCTEEYCEKFLEKFNIICPSAKLTMDDVFHVHWGLVPCRPPNGHNHEIPSVSKKFRIIDLSTTRRRRIINVLGVKYTTVDDVAKKVLKFIKPEVKFDFNPFPQLTGGEMENFASFKDSMMNKWKENLKVEEIDRLLINYGSETESLLAVATKDRPKKSTDRKPPIDIIKAETIFAVRQEMAQKLSDVVLRRTDRGTAGLPSDSDLRAMSLHLSNELGWSVDKTRAEIDELKKYYQPFLRSKGSLNNLVLM
jgi:glycerol-3-phosphate dehydrogenase